MYFPTFFPAAVRPYDGRPPGLGGPMELNVMGTGREREIPLDLSIKTVRQTPDSTADPDEVGLLLDHRKFLNLAGFASRGGMPGSMLDPTALFRLPYRIDNNGCASGLMPSIASPFCHPMMAGLLQQRERCMDPHQHARTAAPQPVSPYMDPATAAALSMHLRSAAAAANSNSQREAATAAAMNARGMFGASGMPNGMGIPGYSLFPEFFQPVPQLQPPPSSDPSRRPEEKGAFTSLRPTQPLPPSSSAGDKPFLAATTLEAARYAEHLQRLRDQHLQNKCYVPTTTSSSGPIPGMGNLHQHHHHQQTNNVNCPCCTIPGTPPHPPGLCGLPQFGFAGIGKESASLPSGSTTSTTTSGKCINGNTISSGLGYPTRPTPTSSSSDSRISSFSSPLEPVSSCSSTRQDTMPIYVPTTVWSSGLPTVSSANQHYLYNGSNGKAHAPTTPSPRKKESSSSQNHKDIPRAAKDFPVDKVPLFIPNTVQSKDTSSAKLAELASRNNPHLIGNQLHHHTIHFSHQGNQNDDRDIIVIDDLESKSVKPSHGLLPGGPMCNGLRIPKPITGSTGIHLPHRPVPEHRPRSPHGTLNSTHSSSGSKRSRAQEYPEVIQSIPAKMPRLEAVVRHNPGLPEPSTEARSPTGPPPLIASVVTTKPVVPSPVYVPIFHGHHQPHTDLEPSSMYLNRVGSKKPLPVFPTPTTASLLAQQYLNGLRMNGIPIDTSCVPSPCPAVAESIDIPVAEDKSLLKFPCGVPGPSDAGTEPSITAAVGDHEKVIPKAISVVPVVLESAGGTSCLRISDEKPAVILSNVNSLPYCPRAVPSSLTPLKNAPAIFKIEKPDIPETKPNPFEVFGTHAAVNQQELKPTINIPIPELVLPVFMTNVETTTVKVEPNRPSPSTSPSKKPRILASEVEEELRLEALRVADARAKKKLRRRLLERLYHERMGIKSPDDQDEIKQKEQVADMECELSSKSAIIDPAVEADKNETSQDRKALSQLNLTWRQRRLMQLSCSHAVRRRRFRSGLDMIARRTPKKKVKNPSNAAQEKRKDEQRKVCDMDEAFAKVVCEVTGDLVMPPEMKRLMVNKALGETILHRASRQCYPDVVLYCLETKCCDVNSRDNAGYTPLHECCSRGHLEIARALLQYGADVNASAAGGIRPLHDAVENDHIEVVRLLLSFGADPTISTYSGLSPLKLARSPIMAEFLRGFMADITGDTDGRSVLPWQFMGSAAFLDPLENGYDVFDGVPSDILSEGEGDGDFLFEVSDSPHLPTFRLQLPSSGSKALTNCLRLSDVLNQTGLTKEQFRRHHAQIEVKTLPKREFEATATCCQLLTGSKLDSLFCGTSASESVDVIELDNDIRALLGIETMTLR